MAVGAARTSSGLSPNLKIGVAQTFLEHGMDEQALSVMMKVIGEASNQVTVDQATNVFVRASRPDLADSMDQQLRTQAELLLGAADEKRNMGDVRGAVQTLLEALHITPSNLQLVVAMVGAIPRQVNELGWGHALGKMDS